MSRQQLQYAQSGKAVNQNSFGNVTFHTVCKYSDTIEYPYNAVLWVHDIVARLVIGRGDWGPLGHFSNFVKYLDFEKEYACVTYHDLLTIHSAT